MDEKREWICSDTDQRWLRLLKCSIAAIALFGQYSLAQTAFDAASLGSNEKAGQYARVRGCNIYYEIYGSGNPLLMLHGNGGTMKDLQHQVPFFANTFKVILVDSRGHGRSADDGDTLTYELMADDLNALLDHLMIDSCCVMGWSDGGINALLLAMRYPKKVKKLAVTGVNLQPDTTAVDPWVHDLVMNMYDSLSHLPMTTELQHRLKLLRLLIFEPHIQLVDLMRVRCPSLIIAGDHDVVRTKHTLLIAEAIPRSYLWILPNSGHSTPVVYSDEFNKVVMEFFVEPFRSIDKGGRFR